jgi:ribonuclease BN (tRNA processing enzyme)
VRFTVLGKSPAWEDAGGACSSYLVEEGDFRLLIDCGNGAFAKLRERISYAEVDEVLISHFHADHVLDLVPFSYALTLGMPAGARRSRPPLWLPPGGAEQIRALVSVWGGGGLVDAAFEVAEYETGGTLELGPLPATLHPVPHYTLTHAIGLTSPGGGRIVFGADCRESEELTEAARGADILLAEATLPEREPDSVPINRRGHMSPGEAAGVASRAGVGRLVLTHISDQVDADAALADAREQFAGPVEIAAEGSSWDL